MAYRLVDETGSPVAFTGIAMIDNSGGFVDYAGTWLHKKSQFPIERERLGARQASVLADRGLTHVFGSEAASKWPAQEKKQTAPNYSGKVYEKEELSAEARVDYRDRMYEDRWATGERISSATPQDRTQVLFTMEVAKTVKAIVSAAFTKAPDLKDHWLDPGTNEAVPLAAWCENYLANDDEDEGGAVDEEGNKLTKGAVRRAMHMEEAQRLYAEEVRRKDAAVQIRKVVGTKI